MMAMISYDYHRPHVSMYYKNPGFLHRLLKMQLGRAYVLLDIIDCAYKK
jgi:hypothetical protein